MIRTSPYTRRFVASILPWLIVAALSSCILPRFISTNKTHGFSGHGRPSALKASLEALDAFSKCETNRFYRIALDPQYAHVLNLDSIPSANAFGSVRGNIAKILVIDVFYHSIPDFMGNQLDYRILDHEVILGFVQVLCMRDTINEVSKAWYRESPEIRSYHAALFYYMEMSIMRHIDPDCDIKEYQVNIKVSLDKFFDSKRISEVSDSESDD